MTAAPPPTSWTETAYDWLQRSNRKRALDEIPQNSTSAAWLFWRGKTGLTFLDAALRRPAANSTTIVAIHGEIAKTWTIVSLAARFVVNTRESQFPRNEDIDEEPTAAAGPPPQVIVLDGGLDVTFPKLAYAVRSCLLRQDAVDFEGDTQDCLRRIHIIPTTTQMLDWVPVLECIKYRLRQTAGAPTVILWDGFLEEREDKSAEVVRQLLRLVDACPSLVLVTTRRRPAYWTKEWNRRITHRIQLQRKTDPGEGHPYVANVLGKLVPFSITMSGILS